MSVSVRVRVRARVRVSVRVRVGVRVVGVRQDKASKKETKSGKGSDLE